MIKYYVNVRGLAHEVDLDLHIPPLHGPWQKKKKLIYYRIFMSLT